MIESWLDNIYVFIESDLVGKFIALDVVTVINSTRHCFHFDILVFVLKATYQLFTHVLGKSKFVRKVSLVQFQLKCTSP